MKTMRRAAAIACGCAVVHAAGAGQPQYTIVDLTELAEAIGVAQSEARGINEAGEVAGFEIVSDVIERAIRWDARGTAHSLHPLSGDNSTIAIEIEADGSVLGLSELVEIVPCGPLICIYEAQKAARWQGNTLLDLNSLVIGGDTSFDLQFAWDADAAGRIIGWGHDPDGPLFEPRGFLLDQGFVTNLGALDRPVAINDADQVVGWNSTGQDHAYLWQGGALVNLHDHPATGGVTSRAWDINDAGLIADEVQFEISDPEEPAAWIGLVPTKLVPELARPQGVATAVNGAGAVVGFYINLDNLNDTWHGFIWQDGARSNLLDLVSPDEGWEILYPFDINSQGQIVGGGLRNGQLGRAFLMTPRPACPWDLDQDGAVAIGDFLGLLGAWGSNPGVPPDFDGDGTVGISDFLAFLVHWGPCP